MKKIIRFIILMCALLITTSTVSATAFTKELLIVKQNKTVYYFDINNYRDANMYVISDVLVNPKVSDLVILETPKEAWPIINRVEDGIYFSYTNKQDAQIKALREENAKLKKYKEDVEWAEKVSNITMTWIAGIIAIIALMFIIFGRKIIGKKEEG